MRDTSTRNELRCEAAHNVNPLHVHGLLSAPSSAHSPAHSAQSRCTGRPSASTASSQALTTVPHEAHSGRMVRSWYARRTAFIFSTFSLSESAGRSTMKSIPPTTPCRVRLVSSILSSALFTLSPFPQSKGVLSLATLNPPVHVLDVYEDPFAVLHVRHFPCPQHLPHGTDSTTQIDRGVLEIVEPLCDRCICRFNLHSVPILCPSA